jgi:hypothetical protein
MRVVLTVGDERKELLPLVRLGKVALFHIFFIEFGEFLPLCRADVF